MNADGDSTHAPQDVEEVALPVLWKEAPELARNTVALDKNVIGLD
jgi:hypothetical protein